MGRVRDYLKKKKENGRKGWKVPIKDLKDAIDAYESDKDKVDPAYDYVVFSVNGQDLSILGVDNGSSPQDPGEFDQFPPWP
jgi:hypothetical protein